jgi:hypothetical protein
MTQDELEHFLSDYRHAVDTGVDETPEWGVLVTVTMEHCETPDRHEALIRGINEILLAHFEILERY